MRRTLTLTALLTALVAPTVTASAAPTADFTYDAQQVVGSAHTYDASASLCDVPPCTYTWRWYRPTTMTSYDRLGTPMGTGPVITFAFSSAGVKNVVLVVVDSGSTHGRASVTRGVVVK